MNPVVAIVQAVVSWVAGVIIAGAGLVGVAVSPAFATALATNLLIMAAVVAAQFLIAAKPRGTTSQGQELSLKLDPTQPRQVIVGRATTGGSLVYAFTWTDDSKSPNKYLVRVIALSDYPVTGIYTIYDGSSFLTFGTNDRQKYFSQSTAPSSGYTTGDLWQNTSTSPYVWYVWNGSAWVTTGNITPSIQSGTIYSGLTACDQYRSKSGAARMWLRVHTGTLSGAVADSYLTAHSPGGEWNSSMKGTGIAYAVVVYQYDTDAFPNGEPQLQFCIDGAPCYDDRLSGSMSLSIPTGWSYTRNPVTIAAQFLRGFQINGVTIVGSQADSRDLTPAAVSSAANICDTVVNLPITGTEAQYSCDLILASNNTVQQDLQAIMDATGGKVYDRGGNITLQPGASYTPVLSLTDADVIWSAPKSWQPTASLSNLYNCVQGSYVPKSLNYQAAAYPAQRSATYQTQDGGQRIVLNWDLPAITSDSQVQRVTYAALVASRFSGTLSFVMPLWGLQLEQGDWFTMTSTRFGFTGLYFQVAQITLTSDFQVAIVAQQTSTTIPGWNPATQYIAPAYGISSQTRGFSLGNPTFTLAASNTTDGAGNAYPVITLVATGSTGNPVQYYELQMRKTSVPATVWSLANVMNDVGSGTGTTVISGLLPGTSYDIQIRTNDGNGHTSAWTSWSSVTTTSALSVVLASGISGQGALATLNAVDWASQITGSAKPADNATKNIITRSTTAPSGASVNDIWILTNGGGTPQAVYAYNGSTWVLGADITAVNTALAITGQGALATLNSVAYGSGNVSGFGALAGLSYVTTGTTQIYSGTYGYLNDAAIVTAIGTASGINGQTAWATYTGYGPAAVTHPGANIVFDGGLTLRGQNWTFGSGWGIGFDSGIGYFASINGPISSASYFYSAEYPVYPSSSYSFSFDGGGQSFTSGFVYVDWHTSAHAYISSSSQVAVTSGNGYNRYSATVTSPSNAAYGIIVACGLTIASGGFFVVKKLKVELSSTPTPFTDDATNGAIYQSGQTIDSLKPAQVNADVTGSNVAAGFSGQGNMSTQNASSVSITGGTLTVGSGGVVIQSGSSGARITISNSVIQVYDSSNTLRVRMGLW